MRVDYARLKMGYGLRYGYAKVDYDYGSRFDYGRLIMRSMVWI